MCYENSKYNKEHVKKVVCEIRKGATIRRESRKEIMRKEIGNYPRQEWEFMLRFRKHIDRFQTRHYAPNYKFFKEFMSEYTRDQWF
jgi:hypothetical protein